MNIKTIPWGFDPHRFTSEATQERDWNYWLTSINRASLVMLHEAGILDAATARRIAEAESKAEEHLRESGEKIEDIMPLEKLLIQNGGQETTLIHTGRSRQDIFATLYQGKLRNSLIDFFETLNQFRRTLLKIAEENIETYIPAYTNGVQAMPITLAFYLWAFLESFERDADRLKEAWKRANRCALGTAVLACSSNRLNRERLAELLGFDGPILNGLDSSQVSLFDIPIEAASILSNVAVRIGVLVQDLAQQYSQVHPWFLLDSGSAYGSSAMPQKRNPGILNKTRAKASEVIGEAQTVTLRAHNLTLGMYDNKDTLSEDCTAIFGNSVYLLLLIDEAFKRMKINKERALQELNNDWTATMSLAETLQKQHGLPFRIGHTFASALVTEARPKNFIPENFPFETAKELYGKVTKELTGAAEDLPMTEVQFRTALSPSHSVSISAGAGAPNADSVAKGLAETRRRLLEDEGWVKEKHAQVRGAEALLEERFNVLMD